MAADRTPGSRQERTRAPAAGRARLRWPAIGLLAALPLLLAACKTPDEAGPGEAESRDSLAQIDLQRSEPPRPPAVLIVPPSKPAAATVAASSFDPQRLIGMDLLQTANLLGQPASQEEKPPALVWRYNGKNCELSIFFYADINTRVFQALTYEIRNEDLSETDKRRCLDELVRENAT